MYDETFLAKIFPMLRDAFNSLSLIWNGRFYYIVPPENVVYPCGVWHSQDSGGRKNDSIGANAWNGLITFRSIARSLTDCETNLLTLATNLPGVTHAEYDISYRIERPIILPIEEDSQSKIYTNGLIVEFDITKK